MKLKTTSMNKFVIVIACLLLLFFLAVTCADSSHEGHEDEHDAHLMEFIRQHQSDINYDELNMTELDSAKLLMVHADLPHIDPFLTEKRIHQLTSFPCSNCHTQPLATMQANSQKNSKKAHWDIQLAHADESAMNCTTCHAKDNMNQLSSLTGQLIKIDESFKLCGQCHSSQYKDWQGGAHGKQLNGWKPPRVATTCVSCHNPHQPAFPKRFPARLNTNQLGE